MRTTCAGGHPCMHVIYHIIGARAACVRSEDATVESEQRMPPERAAGARAAVHLVHPTCPGAPPFCGAGSGAGALGAPTSASLSVMYRAIKLPACTGGSGAAAGSESNSIG